MSKLLGYMARDQYGETYHIENNPPRKWLLNYFGRKTCNKMYVQTTLDRAKHVGYVIAGHWLTVYKVYEWKEASK